MEGYTNTNQIWEHHSKIHVMYLKVTSSPADLPQSCHEKRFWFLLEIQVLDKSMGIVLVEMWT